MKFVIAGALGAMVVLALAFGSITTFLAALVFVFAVFQGLWRGATELLGLVVGMVIAALLAAPLGRAMSGVTASIFGTGGLTNRFLSIALVAVIITVIFAATLGFAAKRWLKKHENWKRWDPFAGAALGAIEGSILAMLVLWVPLAMEPLAQSRLREEAEEAAQAVESGEEVVAPSIATSLATTVVEMSKKVHESALGNVAEATNPVAGSQLIVLASDFAAVTRDPAAMDYFLATPVMQDIHNLPSLNAAMEQIKADAELSRLFDAAGVSIASIRAILDSDALLLILDTTTVVEDLMPRAEEIAAAVAEAKTKIGTPAEGDPRRGK